MKPDSELEQELERLGRLLAPQSSIVERVMARIDELPQRRARARGGGAGWRIPRLRWRLRSRCCWRGSLVLRGVRFQFRQLGQRRCRLPEN